ncbi:MAG: nicotinate phosphoribosyltransferase [Nitrososphaerota archaeon]|jgi:nicotinate phosphoribosyltransferase|nr:nicotinate phosphoribosyltransferase [Nitrososphaerota archaeon]
MKDLDDRMFWISGEDEIKKAEVTDSYFINTERALRKIGKNPKVTMEVYTRHLPYADTWGVLSGVYEAAKLLEGLPLDVDSMDEGEVFAVPKNELAYEPVMKLKGRYADFARYETPLLGFLASASGFTTKAARIRLAAGDRTLLSFGTRRAHPALAPLVERSAYIAGFEGVSNICGAKLLGIEGAGTMPHSFILCFDSQKDAWKAFADSLPEKSDVIVLADTLFDEKTESIMALETLGRKLKGVRLDTPASRRGDWRKIIEEVRWELNLRGGKHVKIFVSGGLDESDVRELQDVVSGFGVGTSVSNAPSIDFNMKMVEVEGKGGVMIPRAKRGDLSGEKEVCRDEKNMVDYLVLARNARPQNCNPLLKPLIRNGRIVRRFETIDALRKRVASRLKWVAGRQIEVRAVS